MKEDGKNISYLTFFFRLLYSGNPNKSENFGYGDQNEIISE